MPLRPALAALAIVVLPAFAAAAAGESQVIRLTAAQRQAAGIATDPAQPAAAAGAGGGGLRLQGRVIVPSGSIAVVQASVAGQLEAMFVSPGQSVRAGAALGRIYSSELLDLQRDYLEATSGHEVAGARLRRDESLHADGIVAESRLLESRAGAVSAAAALQQRRHRLLLAGMTPASVAALRSPEQMSPRLTLTAPRAGIILDHGVDAGARIQNGDALFRLATGRELSLEIQATQAEARRLAVGDAFAVEGCRATGRVAAIGSQLDPGTQLVEVRGRVTADAGCLNANQYVRVAVSAAREFDGALSIAAAAIVRIREQDWVFVDEAAGLRAVPVQVLQVLGARAVVRAAGLRDGAAVVSRGVAALKGSLQGLGAAGGG